MVTEERAVSSEITRAKIISSMIYIQSQKGYVPAEKVGETDVQDSTPTLMVMTEEKTVWA